MRRLLYVPIVHDEADMGRAGPALVLRGEALSGEGRWATHQVTVRRFWQSVADYLRAFEPSRLKLYQDGLAAEGETGRRIVEQAAVRGSENYRLVLALLNQGAEVRKTEDPALLLQTYKVLQSLIEDPTGSSRSGAQASRSEWDRLLTERDRFIAERIDATLLEGEVGVLFIGADHNVASLLRHDVSVETVKDPNQIRDYSRELILEHRDDKRLEELARYLSSPVREPVDR